MTKPSHTPAQRKDVIRKFTAVALALIFVCDTLVLALNSPTLASVALSVVLWAAIAGWTWFFIREESKKRRPPTPPRLIPRFYLFFYFSWVCLLSGLVLVRAANSGVEFYSGLAAVLVLFPGALWMARLRV